jgi:hypothetical protein
MRGSQPGRLPGRQRPASNSTAVFGRRSAWISGWAKTPTSTTAPATVPIHPRTNQSRHRSGIHPRTHQSRQLSGPWKATTSARPTAIATPATSPPTSMRSSLVRHWPDRHRYPRRHPIEGIVSLGQLRTEPVP